MSHSVDCVAAILCGPEGRVLVQQRDDRPDLRYGGYWTLPGGRVEPGEAPYEAIERELREELELEPPLVTWRIYEREGPGSITVVQHVYSGSTDREIGAIACNEGQALRFVGSQELAELPVAYGFDALLVEFFAEQGHTSE